MRIACTSTPDGNVYLFYRTEQNVTAALKPVIPILLASRVDIVVGRVADDPLLLMKVGPLSGVTETTLLTLLDPYVTTPCSPALI